MKHLLSTEGQEALRGLAGARVLYAFDFDGTLAPIVARPPDARAAIGVRQRLAQLAQRAPVAVVSGRSLADLRDRVPVEIRHCIGNHGNEGLPDSPDPQALHAVCRSWTAQLEAALADAKASGIVVEDKRLTLSVHYRLARDREQAARALAQIVQRLDPAPRVIGGKLVLNLLPPGARTKFEALAALAERERAQRVLFVGDDETDELVFAQAPAHWITVRVELDRASRANYFIHRQSEIVMLLDQMLQIRGAPMTRDDEGMRE
ncbi:MAG: trehalose-phosphatase [Burkholderiaceae bacterium]